MNIKRYNYLIYISFIISCSDTSTNPDDKINSIPVASLSAYPDSGTTFTYFIFDATNSSDENDSLSTLEVRWDWDNDQNWDTGFSQSQNMSHNFSALGEHTVTMEIKDPKGLSDTITVNVHVSGVETGTVTDIDGNVYNTVKIGNQWWMAENLKVRHYQNGDSLVNETDIVAWYLWGEGVYCSYNNSSSNAYTYGLLYNWYTVDDSRNIAPVGWHIPSDEEWQELVSTLGGDSLAGGKMKEASLQYWQYPNYYATNCTGFSALPGGGRWGIADAQLGEVAFFWSATESISIGAWYYALHYGSSGIGRTDFSNGLSKKYGYSVRCVKD